MSARRESLAEPSVLEIQTPVGVARAHVFPAPAPAPDVTAAIVLGHGAGGGIAARDLVAVRDVALAEHVSVALVEQPYRVAGRRSPAPARQLDTAWAAVLERLRVESFRRLSLICGGRSSGARVACRTAAETGAVGVLCLAFPLQPPGRSASGEPRPDRLSELEAVRVPTLVVQGESDPFGIPPGRRGRRRVVVVPGDHSLRNVDPVRTAVRPWLRRLRDRGRGWRPAGGAAADAPPRGRSHGRRRGPRPAPTTHTQRWGLCPL